MTNRQKKIAYPIIFVLVLWLSYVFAIQKTIAYKTEYEKMKTSHQFVNNPTAVIQKLKLQEHYLDSVLKSNNIELRSSFQQLLLQKITNYTKEHAAITIREFNAPHVFKKENDTIKTYSVNLESDFISLLKALNNIENQRLADIKSVNFIKQKNYRRNKNDLIMKMFLEKID